MKSIRFISNLDPNEHSGGWSGMNYHLFIGLSNSYLVNFNGKIELAQNKKTTIISKVQKLFRFPRFFPSFHKQNLKENARIVNEHISKSDNLVYFHGATPWVEYQGDTKYICYLDCCFATYLGVYHPDFKIKSKQKAYIFEKEKCFLERAHKVFFSSRYALEECKNAYSISGENFAYAGLGGAIQLTSLPLDQASQGTSRFLFIALDFIGKGGGIIVQAFNEISIKHKNVQLDIVGQKPAQKFLTNSKIQYHGFLNKSNEDELLKFSTLFKAASCLLLPSNKDMTPLVVLEAANFGKPTITTDLFGIPELIINGETGFLVKRNKHDLKDAMLKLIENQGLAEQMGKNALKYVKENFSWNLVLKRIRMELND